MEKVTITSAYGSIEFGENLPFKLVSIDANSVGSSCQVYTAIESNGQRSGQAYYKARVIPCELAIEGTDENGYSHVDYLNKRNQVFKIINPHTKAKLSYTNDLGTYCIEVRIEEIPKLEKVCGELYKFTLDFIADYPFWCGAETTSNRFGTITGGFTIPLEIPTEGITFGEWNKSFTYVNDTTLGTPFSLEIDSVGDYCKISNEKGEFIKINKALAVGQKLIIDTATGLVTLVSADGTETIDNGKVSLDSNMVMKLHHGENVLTFDNGIISLPQAIISIKQLYNVI